MLLPSFDFSGIEIVTQREDAGLLRVPHAILARFRVQHKWRLITATGHRHKALAIAGAASQAYKQKADQQDFQGVLHGSSG